jgi:hypothetical protein
MDEDTDDKIRRNLVVVSAAVVVGAWLELGAGSVLERVLGQTTATTITPWRLWAAVLALLAYLALRYRFSEASRSALKLLRTEVHSLSVKAATKALDAELSRFGETRRESDAPSFPGIKKAVEALDPPPQADPTRRLHSLGFGNRETNFVGEVQFISTVGAANNTVRTAFKFGTMRRLWLKAKVASRLVCYSQTSTTLLVPLALAAVATGVAIWRLVQALP